MSLYMEEALALARRPKYPPHPNPYVGCVIVKNGRVVGRGWHAAAGRAHAEAVALAEAGARAKGATLYVTLEPCCHTGRTPPCTDAILRAGIAEVVYAVRDPNPAVAGGGARMLKSRGTRVRSGVCTKAAEELNEVYFRFRRAGLPFVTLKAATSLDGKTATDSGESKWITDIAARRVARELRAQHQAVLVGVNTVLGDNPHLGPRLRGAPEPWRVVLDSRLRTPPQSQVVQSGRCILACTDPTQREALEAAGATVWTFEAERQPVGDRTTLNTLQLI